MRVARRFLISGRVQGVGFRYYAERVASRDGIHGWVRNLPDGRVEVFAEGEIEAVDRLHQGE
jgi:acylphosphatase